MRVGAAFLEKGNPLFVGKIIEDAHGYASLTFDVDEKQVRVLITVTDDGLSVMVNGARQGQMVLGKKKEAT